jgi:hypothetical protein
MPSWAPLVELDGVWCCSSLAERIRKTGRALAAVCNEDFSRDELAPLLEITGAFDARVHDKERSAKDAASALYGCGAASAVGPAGTEAAATQKVCTVTRESVPPVSTGVETIMPNTTGLGSIEVREHRGSLAAASSSRSTGRMRGSSSKRACDVLSRTSSACTRPVSPESKRPRLLVRPTGETGCRFEASEALSQLLNSMQATDHGADRSTPTTAPTSDAKQRIHSAPCAGASALEAPPYTHAGLIDFTHGAVDERVRSVVCACRKLTRSVRSNRGCGCRCAVHSQTHARWRTHVRAHKLRCADAAAVSAQADRRAARRL